jgi:polyferredoxin
MPANYFIFGIMALAIINGMFSLFLLVTTTRIVIPTFAPAFLLTSPTVVVFLGYLLGATVTVILAGVPAALFERATARSETDTASWSIWLVAAALLTLPALTRAISLIG